MQDDEPLVVSPQRAAQMLGFGHDALYKRLNSGQIESYRDGSRRRVVVASVKAYIKRKVDGDAFTTRARRATGS